MSIFNGKSMLLDSHPVTTLFTDACVKGGGGVLLNDWFYVNWEIDYPQVLSAHINEKEILAVVLSVFRWAEQLRNRKIYIFSDNTVTVNCINKCSSRNNFIMHALRSLFWISACFNFHITARHIPGCYNVEADKISRMHDKEFFKKVVGSPDIDHSFTQLLDHMSENTFISLLSRHTQK